MMMIAGSTGSRLLSKHQLRYYICLVGLVCLAALRYNQIDFDDEDGATRAFQSPRQLLQNDSKFHSDLDVAFLDVQQASSSLHAQRTLGRELDGALMDAQKASTPALASDSQSTPLLTTAELTSDSSSSVGGISSTCSDLGITEGLVAKSRILGNTDRWHQVLKKIKDGESVKVAVLGGSVPSGSECEEDHEFGPNFTCAWPANLETMLRQHKGVSQIEFVNLAHGGTPSSAGLTQIMELPDYDAIIIQWTANDDHLYEGHEEESKQIFETLIRTALSLPKNPAVIIFESLGMRVLGMPEPVAEIMHYAIASVYEIPVISARAAFWRQKSFDAKKDWSNNEKRAIHPNAMWHRRFACLMYENWIKESESTTDMSDWLDPLDQPPVYGGSTLHCQNSFSASAFKETLEHAPSDIGTGWSYYADAPTKFGYISNTTDSLLEFEIPHEGGDERNGEIVELYMHYLRSYTPEWGSAEIKVNDGEPLVIDSRWDDHASQIDVIKVDLKSSEAPFKVTIKNLFGKVKIVEVLLFSCVSE